MSSDNTDQTRPYKYQISEILKEAKPRTGGSCFDYRTHPMNGPDPDGWDGTHWYSEKGPRDDAKVGAIYSVNGYNRDRKGRKGYLATPGWMYVLIPNREAAEKHDPKKFVGDSVRELEEVRQDLGIELPWDEPTPYTE